MPADRATTDRLDKRTSYQGDGGDVLGKSYGETTPLDALTYMHRPLKRARLGPD
jgi:hypothetical protein